MVSEESAAPLTVKPLPLDRLVTGSNLLQTGFWGAFKSHSGWKPRGFSWATAAMAGSLLVLERTLPGGFSLAYVPYGPTLPDDSSVQETSSFLVHLAKGLAGHLSRSCFMLRFDLTGGTQGPIGLDPGRPGGLRKPLRKAPYRVQPPDTVILPLAGGEQEILSGMHRKTRYNIRLAAKKGVCVRRLEGEGALESLPQWYSLYRETGARDGITLHSEAYYRRLFAEESSFPQANLGFSLYMAEHESEALGGIIVSHCGKRATYMYGASSSRKRELMPNHLLQWQAIKDAIAAGIEEYDFYGIPPSEDIDHPMHGLWRFKTGFGGRIHHYLGAWDYPYRPAIYRLYAIAESLRSRIAARRKRHM